MNISNKNEELKDVYAIAYSLCDKDKLYCVEFSNGVTMNVSAEEFFEHSLYDSDEPVSGGFELFCKKLYSKRAFSEGVRFVLNSRKSEQQIRKLLLDKNYDEECVENAIDNLREDEYINDAAFALKLIKKAVESRIVSTRMLICELKQKGISEEVAEACMEKLEIDDYLLAVKAVNKKRASGIDDIRKLQRFLAGKGFSGEIIRKIFHEDFS